MNFKIIKLKVLFINQFRIKIFSTGLCILLIFSCNKENLVNDKCHFDGLTLTNEIGVIISIDSTDWNFKDTWNKNESGLFVSNFQTNCQPAYNYRIAAFPNPCKSKIQFSIDKQLSTVVELRIVDSYCSKFISIDTTPDIFSIFLESFNIKDTVRVYYKFIENNCEFEGHGDILIE